ncbi:MAG: Bax inhibitor-1 family protein [Pirellulales bacterium]
MAYDDNPYRAPTYDLAANAPVDARSRFIMRTYTHLTGAIAAFIGLEAVLLNLPGIDGVVATMFGGQFSWLMVLVAFMVVSWVAQKWAESDASPAMQYLGLGLYVVAEAVIFLPLLYIASRFGGPQVIPAAGLITGVIFGGLTVIVFATRHDFSYLRTALGIAGLAAIGVVIAAMMFGFSLGILFSAAMIVLCSGYILYHTSNVLHHYNTDQHVAASLALFASVATLFWYVLRIVMASRD